MSLKSFYKKNKLHIAGYAYDVRFEKDPRSRSSDDRVLGESDYEGQMIRIASDVLPEQQLSTILHETLHVLDHLFQIGINENAVRRLEAGLHAVLKSNPELCSAYLTLVERESS